MNKRNLAIIILSFFGILTVASVLYRVYAQNYLETQFAEELIETPLPMNEVLEPSITNPYGLASTNLATPTLTMGPTKEKIPPQTTIAPTITKKPLNTLVPTQPTIPEATKPPTPIPEPTKVPLSANPASDFTVQDYNGNSVNLSDFFGKPIVMNFWASWCNPCKVEMPYFNRLYQETKGEVVFLMIDLVDGRRETRQSGYQYVSSQGFSFPVYYDVNQDAAYAYSVTSIPTTYFINADGSIATYHKGTISENTLRNEINKLLQ